jgi:hypothetical protein
MMIYNVQRSNVALSTSNDFMTLISGATRSFLILEIDAEGDGTASSYNEFGLYRVGTAGSTGGGAITPVPVDAPNMTGTTPAIAFSGTVDTTWTTQPTVGGLIHNVPLNSNGQRYFWRCNANNNNAIVVSGGANAAGSISVRGISGSGTGNVSIRLQIAEL